MKWYHMVLLALLSLLLSGCQERPDLPREGMEKKINEREKTKEGITEEEILSYLEKHLLQWNAGSKVACAYDKVGEEETKIYLRAFCIDDQESGISVPLVLIKGTNPKQETEVIVSHDLPKEGSQYQGSLEKLFPSEIRAKLDQVSITFLERQAKERLQIKKEG